MYLLILWTKDVECELGEYPFQMMSWPLWSEDGRLLITIKSFTKSLDFLMWSAANVMGMVYQSPTDPEFWALGHRRSNFLARVGANNLVEVFPVEVLLLFLLSLFHVLLITCRHKNHEMKEF